MQVQSPNSSSNASKENATEVALGVMSGTSADGADAVMISLDGIDRPGVARVLGHHHVAYPPALQQELTRPDKLDTRRIAELHALLPEFYAEAVKGIDGWRRAKCCGMHGQTLWHQTAGEGIQTTLQIGSSALLAQRLELPVVGDMRMADVALEGLGAPLSPFAHWFFARPQTGSLWVVNFGGICNVSHITPDAEDVIGFDVGPGMMLSNAYAAKSTQGELLYDRDGTQSRDGKRVESLYQRILSHPYLQQRPPKSTGREMFGLHFLESLLGDVPKERPADIASTLLEATAEALFRAQKLFGDSSTRPTRLILTGGGAKNPTLVAHIRQRFTHAAVELADPNGPLAEQHHEPAAMALIAARTFAQLPSSLPRVTGALRPSILGHVQMPAPL